MDNTPKDLAVVSCNYSVLVESGKDYQDFCSDLLADFFTRYTKYCQDKSLHLDNDKFSIDNMIILWKNVPDNTKGKVSFNSAFDLLCGKKDELQGTIYVRSFDDLASAYGFEKVMRYLCQLKNLGRKIVFLDDDYFSLLPDNIKMSGNSSDSFSAFAVQALSFENALSHMERKLLKNGRALIDGFAEFYWDWQRLMEPIESCKEKIGVWHRTLYKYSDMYEGIPYYVEHMKLFPSIKNYPKRGTLPDKDLFFRDEASLAEGRMTEKEFFAKYRINSKVDIERIHLALEKRKRMTRQ